VKFNDYTRERPQYNRDLFRAMIYLLRYTCFSRVPASAVMIYLLQPCFRRCFTSIRSLQISIDLLVESLCERMPV